MFFFLLPIYNSTHIFISGRKSVAGWSQIIFSLKITSIHDTISITSPQKEFPMIYDNLALANALIFDNAYHILKQRMDIGTVSHSQLDMSLAVPVAVNCSFSCEMLLKSMLPIGTRGHGINDLFTQLTTSEQSGIVDGTMQLLRLHKTDYTTENFYSDLNHHDKAFIQWRYFHEKHDGNLNFNILFMEYFHETLKALALFYNKNPEV